MSSWATPERLLELLTASPQYAGSVADRLADLARELQEAATVAASIPATGGEDGDTAAAAPDAPAAAAPQVDLLWRIAAYLFRRRWETRAAAALALERVGLAVAHEALAQVLFGLAQVAEGEGGGESGDCHEAQPVAHGGLLSLADLDLGRVLRDGEPLLASTGEEYSLGEARGSLSREELEAQKRAVLRRLGLEVHDAEARQALEIGGGGFDGFGIQEADLTAAGERAEGAGTAQGGSRPRRQRKRKLGDMALEEAAAATSAATTSRRPRGGNRDRASAADASAATSSNEGREEERAKEQERQPWLAEHLSVRLFDAGWESRHGAALGLTALFKAWRQRRQRGAGVKGWTRRLSEDVAGRCLCLLALDRFGDFSMGGAVAPIREVAGQLLGLVLAPDATATAAAAERAKEEGEGRGPGLVLLQQALGHLQTLAAGAEEADEDGGELRPWEVRHGAFVGLKYLVVLPSEPVRAIAPALLRLACGALHDTMEDVREAAATTIHSLLLLLPPSSDEQGGAAQVEIDVPAILLPIFQALHPDAGTAATADSSSGAAAAGAAAAAVAAALFLPVFLRLASSVLDRVLSAQAGTTTTTTTALLPLSFWSAPAAPPMDELLGALWALGCSSEPGARGPALGLLTRVLRYWAAAVAGDADGGDGDEKGQAAARRGKGRKGKGNGGGDARGRVQERGEALAWEVLKALGPGRAPAVAAGQAPSPEVLQGLQAVWAALVAALGPTRATALAPRVADDWLALPGAAPVPTIFPVGAADDWGARRRTAAALAQLSPELVMARAVAARVDVRERAALLVGQCLGRAHGQDDDGREGALGMLQTTMEQGLASLAESETHRRLAVAAAGALVEAGAAQESPGPAIRALMEAVKGEGDKERQAVAIDALVALVASLLGAGKGRKAVERVVGNLCMLACAMQQADPALAGARAGAREALKGLVARLGPQALESLPVLWLRITAGIQGHADGSAEDAVRLLMVITPAVAEEGAALVSIRSLAEGLVRLAAAGEPGNGGGATATTATKLVSLLAARCLSILFKRGEAGGLAARVGPLLHRALQDRGEETARQRAANCLLELAKALRALPPSLESEARAALPALLPPALATVADEDPGVRSHGAEAFRLLVELAPLLQQQEWTQLHEGLPPPDAAEARARESVRLLVLGGRGGEKGAAAACSSSFTWPAALPGLLRGGLELRPYQWEGVRWLTLLRRAGLHGALCDEMGLGKTLQTLAALAVARCEHEETSAGTKDNDGNGGLPSLVLCPASLSGHWLHEARRFLAPHAVEPLAYRTGLSRQDKAALVEGATGRHLVVASYDLLRRDVALLASRPWAFLLLDEAHVLRGGQGTALGRAVRRLRAAHRVALTGTPLQNQVQDVWAVFDLLMPGLLGDRRAFDREYGRPIGRATLRSAGVDATAEALARLDRLHAHLLPFLLRREKATVLRDLPPKTVTDLACDLVPLQREMYDGHCATGPAQEVLSGLAALVADEGGGGGGRGQGGLAGGKDGVREQLGGRALRLLHYLRLLCVHPALVLEAASPAREHLLGEADCSGKMVALQQLLFACGVFEECCEVEPEEEGEGEGPAETEEGQEEDGAGEEEEEEVADADAAAPAKEEEDDGEEPAPEPSPLPSPSHPGQPAAAAAAAAAGGGAAGGGAGAAEGLHRCLVFAQHRVTLDAIERAILRRAKWNGAYAALAEARDSDGGGGGGGGGGGARPRYLRLDGSVPSGQREALVQRFNADASIALMLLTTRVGGLGLNLTGADVVIFVEHDWNPAVDLQAMDRAHRIGQGRPVNVYRLVTQGTVEEQVLALQRRKQEMAAAVVQPGNAGRFEERGMAGVLDLVAASVGRAPPQQAPAAAAGAGAGASSAGAFAGALAAPPAGGGADAQGSLPLPSEEVWDEGQYSGFAVEAFLANVLGVSSNGGGEGGGKKV